MRIKSIAAHLRPYRMLASRRTTIAHMFAAAIAPHDTYDEVRVSTAVAAMGNDPAGDLTCAYCGNPAETWDHIFATVKGSRFSGHGHRLGNLLPCCKPCNSRKGNKHWEAYLISLDLPVEQHSTRHERITCHINTYGRVDAEPTMTADHQRLEQIREQILQLMRDADEVAFRIREKIRKENGCELKSLLAKRYELTHSPWCRIDLLLVCARSRHSVRARKRTFATELSSHPLST